MGLVLDTSVIIGAEKKKIDLRHLLIEQPITETVVISVITASELLLGCERASNKSIREKRVAFVEAILDQLPIVDFKIGEARRHAELWANLEGKGIRIGAYDMIIAATCLNIKARLATLNHSEFSRVDGLDLIEMDTYLL